MPEVHDRPAIERVPMHHLDARHRPAILRHLSQLDSRDRYLRFGYAASDVQIERYVASIDFERDEVYGVFNRRLQLIAMAHLAVYEAVQDRPGVAEFGVSVAARYRGRRYGQQLFERAVRHARNEGIQTLIIHALTENHAMMSIATKSGAKVHKEGGKAEAVLSLPPADLQSQWVDLLEDQVGWTDYQFKRHIWPRTWAWPNWPLWGWR